MKIREMHRHQSRGKLPMAPMIDVVFLLLIFFIMTFKITALEGDFQVKLPAKGGDGFNPPVVVKLQSDSDGGIVDIILRKPSGDESLGTDFQRLSENMIAYLRTGPEEVELAQSTEIIFDCDESLHYEEAIKAVTAVSGYINEEGEIVTLAENVSFHTQQ